MLLVLLPGFALAQSDTTVVKGKEGLGSNKFLPTGIRVGTDLIAIAKSQFQNDFSGWEVNAEMDISRYFLAFDYGSWSRNFSSDSASYRNEGSYWRAGIDVNFLLNDPDRNVFFIGYRYARGSFSDSYDYIVIDPVWGVVHGHAQNDQARARWMELTTGLRVKIWEFLWMGYTARFKFGLKTHDIGQMIPHDVPGYGKTHKENYWGFNYQIFVRLPLRKAPPVVPTRR